MLLMLISLCGGGGGVEGECCANLLLLPYSIFENMQNITNCSLAFIELIVCLNMKRKICGSYNINISTVERM